MPPWSPARSPGTWTRTPPSWRVTATRSGATRCTCWGIGKTRKKRFRTASSGPTRPWRGVDPERFAAWLFRIVVNRCRTARRRLLRHHRFDADLPHDVPSNGARPDAFEWRDEITRALSRLRPHYREAFLLRYVEELDYGEMSRVTGVKEPALRMRVKRASDQLRNLLRDLHAG